MRLISVICILLLSVFSGSVKALTYFVDSEYGNDSWTGTESTSTADSLNGPWQSLHRLSSALLKPGDIVKLRCGRTWTEALTIKTSGSASAPITYTHYPDNCDESKPIIRGSVEIRPHEWRAADPNRRYASRQINLIQDPEFVSATALWKTWSPKNDSLLGLSSNCGNAEGYCLQLQSGTGTTNTVNYSQSFEIQSQTNYTLKFSYYAAAGIRLRFVVRRGAPPFDDAGFSGNYFGTGKWESVSVEFKSTRELKNARLDIEMPPGRFISKVDSIHIERQIPAAIMIINGEKVVAAAHHPNVGHNSVRPKSTYLVNSEDSDRVLTSAGTYGSNYVTIGSDVSADFLQMITPGNVISLRVTSWMLEERRITSVSGNRIYLDRPTTYQMRRGWGYFLRGSSWMIDEPNEWANDESLNRIYLSSITSFPEQPIRAVITPVCINASGQTGITIDGLEIRGCGSAIDITNSRSIILKKVYITHQEKYGVYAPGATGLSVFDSEFSKIGMEAINGVEQGVGFASGSEVVGNVFREIGVELDGEVNQALPRPSRGALYLGANATILNNRIEHTSYHGIRLAASNISRENVIGFSCMVLDDCGAVYGTRSAESSEISGNVIYNSVGWIEGKPVGTISQSEGIYIDDHANNIVVSGNTVSNCDHGILLHNSSNNYIFGNTLFGNRRHEIWLLEDSNSVDLLGDLSGNVIENNLIFTNTASSSIRLETFVSGTQRFAHFEGNRYSALFSPRVASESSPSFSRSYTFTEWQRNADVAIGAPAGATGGRDLNGSVLQSVGFASYQILTGNLIAESIVAIPVMWTPWSDVLPMAAVQLLPCTQGSCLELRGGGGKSLVASPPFSVREGQSYRISFDVQAPDGLSGIAVVLRRGGGGNNGFEALSPFESVTTASTFRRYAFTFRSPKTINKSDPKTQDIGARIYFERIPSGKTLRIGNLEIVEISPQDATIRSSLVTNSQKFSDAFECPVAGTQPEACASYFDYATDSAVSWPITLEPGESRIVYTLDLTLIDRDNDGIADINDLCPGTTAGVPTNAAGCPLY